MPSNRRLPLTLLALERRQVVVAKRQVILIVAAGRGLLGQSLQNIDRFVRSLFGGFRIAVAEDVAQVVASDRQVARGAGWLSFESASGRNTLTAARSACSAPCESPS